MLERHRMQITVFLVSHVSALVLFDSFLDANSHPLGTNETVQQLKFRKIYIQSSRRDSGQCNTNSCCDAAFFCQAYAYVCVPCSECQFDSDSVDQICINRCSNLQVSDSQYPILLWIYLSSNMVDASSPGKRNVNMLFAVRDDSGLSQAQVSSFCFTGVDCCLTITMRCSLHFNQIRVLSPIFTL
jgi:hypothetical protein